MLARLLRWLTDAELADAIAGDLAEERAKRASRSPILAAGWHLAASIAILWQVALRRRGSVDAPHAHAGGARTRVSGLAAEIRQAARALRRTPVASLVIAGTLALGLGTTTAIFTLVHAVLLQPLPIADPDRVVFVASRRSGGDANLFGTSLLDYQDLRAANRTFADMATTAYWTFTVTGTDVPLRLVGLRVTGSFFPMTGVSPALGRAIGPADDTPGAPEVAVLGHGTWQRVFGGATDIVGRELSLNGVPARIVGVMPREFAFPFEDAQLWLPMRDELATVPRVSRFFATIGRLADHVTPARAQEDLEAVVANLQRDHPDAYRDWEPVVSPALPALTEDARPRLVLLFGAVVVVLLVAGVNLAALISARTTARLREFAIRSALGAGRWRVARVSFLESAWLAVAGLVAGLALAAPAAAALRALAPDGIPRLDQVAIRWPVLAWVAAVMAVFVVIGTAVPLVRLRRLAADAMRATTVAGAPARRARRALVAAQVAAAFVLLSGAGLLVRSYSRVVDVDPGFAPDNLVLMRVSLTPPRYVSVDSQKQFVARALERLAQAPGVSAASTISQPPFSSNGTATSLFVAVEGSAPGATPPSLQYRATSASYFSTAGLRLVDGRLLEDTDRMDAPRVVVLNRAAADRLWPGERAIGRRFSFVQPATPGAPPTEYTPTGALTVVGVVDDVATDGLEVREPPAIYAPYQQRTLPYLRWTTFVVRTRTEPAAALPAVRAALQSVDTNQPLYDVDTMTAMIARSLAERRFSVTLMAAFAGLAVLLATLGLYGALAQTVAARRREIGVRLAVGASPSSVFRRVAGDGLRVVAAGLATGAVVAWALAARIEGLLFGVGAADPLTHAVIAIVLVSVATVACVIPARRASRVDPIAALRLD